MLFAQFKRELPLPTSKHLVRHPILNDGDALLAANCKGTAADTSSPNPEKPLFSGKVDTFIAELRACRSSWYF